MAPYQAWLIHQLPFFTLASGNVSIHFSPPQKNRRNNMTKNMHYCNLNYTEPSPLLYYFSHKLKGRKEKEMMVKRRPFQNAEVTYHPANNCWKTTRKREISYRSNTYILQCVKPQPQSHSFCYYQYCTCNPYTLSHFERPDVQGGAPDLYGLWKMEIHPSCGSPICLAQPTSNYPPVSSSWVVASRAVLHLQAHMKVQSCMDTRTSMLYPPELAVPASWEGCRWDRKEKIPSSNLKQPILEVTAAWKQQPAGHVRGDKAESLKSWRDEEWEGVSSERLRVIL